MAKSGVLLYKGKPLVRKDNVVCYGDVNDKYVVIITILESKEVRGQSIASKVLVQLQNTDESVAVKDKVAKAAEKNSLYEGLDIGQVWLERLLRS